MDIIGALRIIVVMLSRKLHVPDFVAMPLAIGLVMQRTMKMVNTAEAINALRVKDNTHSCQICRSETYCMMSWLKTLFFSNAGRN